jgi:hypothetical protein
MKKLRFSIVVDENGFLIEKKPIGIVYCGDETDEGFNARQKETMRWKQLKLPIWFEVLLAWKFKRIWKRFYEAD